MRDQLLHLLDVELQREQLVQQAESSGGPARIAAHPGFHMLHLIVDLVNHLVVVLDAVELLVVFLQQIKPLFSDSITKE